MNNPRHPTDPDDRRPADPADQAARDQLFDGQFLADQSSSDRSDHELQVEEAGEDGVAVNEFSRAVLPRDQFPVHFDFLMRDLFARGESPEEWQVLAADEARIDEDGMEVEFTLLKIGTDLLWRRRLDIQLGQLRSITDC